MAAQIIDGSGAVSASTGYIGIGTTPTGASTSKSTIITASTTARNLYVTTQDPTGGGSVTVTMRKNGVATALTVTISAGNVSGEDATHSVALVAGDVIDFTSIQAGGGIATTVSIKAQLD